MHRARQAAAAILVMAPLISASCSHAGPAEASRPAPEAAGGEVASSVAPAGVSFSGTWELNRNQSDRSGQGRGIPGGGMGGGAGGGMGGAGGGRPGGTGGGTPGASPRGGPDGGMFAPPQRLVLTQTDSSMIVERNDGGVLIVHFDGRPVVTQGPQEGTTMQVSARWHGRNLEVRRIIADRVTISETYELGKDGGKLIVHQRMRLSQDDAAPPETKLVYDLVSH